MNGEGGIFSLYDTKAEAFLPTFNAPTNAVAIRVVSNMVNGGNDDVICKHPDDFSLFRLGTINLNDGTVIPEKVNLGNCVEFRTHVENVKGQMIDETA